MVHILHKSPYKIATRKYVVRCTASILASGIETLLSVVEVNKKIKIKKWICIARLQ